MKLQDAAALQVSSASRGGQIYAWTAKTVRTGKARNHTQRPKLYLKRTKRNSYVLASLIELVLSNLVAKRAVGTQKRHFAVGKDILTPPPVALSIEFEEINMITSHNIICEPIIQWCDRRLS
jgi:hypothetical protein